MPEERAIPEWKIVKEEILKSYYNAGDKLAEWQRSRERGGSSPANFADFKKYVIEIYLKVRMKIKNRKYRKDDRKKYMTLMELDECFNGKSVNDGRWVEYFFLLGEFIELIGITKIELKEYDEDEAMA